MKTTRTRVLAVLLASILLFSTAPAALSANTDVTAKFTDPIFLEVVRDILGKPTGPIYAEDCAKVIDMNISYGHPGDLDYRALFITSLNGLEYFTALESLRYGGGVAVYDCFLTSIDLSKNTELSYLNFGGTKITKLDLSKNTKLEHLECNDNYLSDPASIILPENCTIYTSISSDSDWLSGGKPLWKHKPEDYYQGQPPENPSGWAMPWLIKAYRLGLVPEDLREIYHEDTTRRAFCELIMELMSSFGYDDWWHYPGNFWAGNDYPENWWPEKDPTGNFIVWPDGNPDYVDFENINIRASRKLTEMYVTREFDDVEKGYVSVPIGDAAALGIVNGTSETTFEPEGLIKREEAAAMLSRALNALCLDASLEPVAWTDGDSISPFAKEHTYKVFNCGIMNGTGTSSTEFKFDPKEEYTYEQTVVTIVRLYEYALEHGGNIWGDGSWEAWNSNKRNNYYLGIDKYRAEDNNAKK